MAINPDCLPNVFRDAGRDLTDKEVKELGEQLEERARVIRRQDPSLDPREIDLRAAQKLEADLKLAAVIEKRNALLNQRKRIELDTYLKNVWSDRPTDGLQAILTGSQRARAGARRSVGLEQHALQAKYTGGLIADIERTGNFKLFASGAADQDIARALWRLDDESPDLKGILPEAVEIARAIKKWQEVSRLDANREGAFIGKERGYVTRQSHDLHKIRRAGYARWRDAIAPKLDLDRMEISNGDIDAFLRATYEGLASGVHLKAETRPKLTGFKGPANLAKRVSQERVLRFKDADEWMAYNSEFGTGSLREAVMAGLRNSARSVGLMRTLGTNPQGMLDVIGRSIQERLHSDPDRLRAFTQDLGSKIKNRLAQVDGSVNIPANEMLARVSANARAIESMAKLGGAVVSSITDIPVYASEVRYQGRGMLSGMAEALSGLAAGRASGERAQVLSSLGVVFDSMVGEITRRGSLDDNFSAGVARGMQQFFKLNLLNWWTDSLRGSAALGLSHFMAREAVQSFDQLHPQMRAMLERYDIDAARWDVIRKSDTTAADGREYLTPDGVADIPDEAIDPLIRDRITQIQSSTADTLAKLEKANERENEWITGRMEKFQQAKTKAEAALSKFETRQRGKVAERSELTEARVELLRAQITRAEVESDIGAFLVTQRDQNRLYTFLQQVEEGKGSDAVGERAEAMFQRYGFTRGAEGERLGERRGRSDRQILELKQKVAQLERDTDRAIKAQSEQSLEQLTSLQEDLEEFIERMRERQGKRAEIAKEWQDSVGKKIGKAREDMREELTSALRAFYVDRAETAVIEPDAETLAIMRQGTQGGTVYGELLRFIGQFKSFGVALTQKVLAREAYGYGADSLGQALKEGQSLRGLANVILASTLFGYAAGAAKDLIKGRTPRDPNDPKTWLAAATQGGGFGIYGDFMLGQYDRMGGDLLSKLAGPVIGVVADVDEIRGRIFKELTDGDGDVAATTLRTLVNNTPFLNLFYTRMALDYALLYEVQEAMNPGYLRRMERRLEKENGQTYWLSPSDAIR